MRNTLIGVSALLLGAGAINLGLGLQASLLGLRADLEGFDVVMTGLIMSSYYAGFVGGSIFAPHIGIDTLCVTIKIIHIAHKKPRHI